MTNSNSSISSSSNSYLIKFVHSSCSIASSNFKERNDYFSSSMQFQISSSRTGTGIKSAGTGIILVAVHDNQNSTKTCTYMYTHIIYSLAYSYSIYKPHIASVQLTNQLASWLVIFHKFSFLQFYIPGLPRGDNWSMWGPCNIQQTSTEQFYHYL